MHLTTLKERRDLITIYELMINLEETDRKDPILTRKGVARYLRGHKKKLQKRICLNDTKKQFSPEKYKYLKRTEGRGGNGKECTSTEGKTINIDTKTGPHECSSGPVYYR